MPDPNEEKPTRSRRVAEWADGLDLWKKILGGSIGIVLALIAAGGLVDQGLKWYLKSYALAADVSKQQQSIDSLSRKVDTGQRLILQDQEIRLTKEVREMEKAERLGKLSTGEQSYLDILRNQRDAVKRQLRILPAAP